MPHLLAQRGEQLLGRQRQRAACHRGHEELGSGAGLLLVRRRRAVSECRVRHRRRRVLRPLVDVAEHALEFLEGRVTARDALESGGAHRAHAVAHGRGLDRADRLAARDHLDDVRRHLEDLREGQAAAVARLLGRLTRADARDRAHVVRAREALLVLGQRIVGTDGLRARRVDAAHEPLGHRAAQRGRDRRVVEAQVRKATDGTGRVVGVQRREHEVAGERGLGRHRGGLGIADLAHEDDVRVLAQDRAERRREGHALLGLHLDLRDAGQFELDRVLDRHDVDVGTVDLLQRGVQRGRLARARGAGHDHDAVAVRQQALEALELRRQQADLRERHRALRVEDADDALLGAARRDRGDAQVEGASVHDDARAPVLRTQPVGDVELRHDLDARDDAIERGERHLAGVHEDAVDAVAHDALVAGRLQVDVARVALDRPLQHEVHQLHHGARMHLVGGHRVLRGQLVLVHDAQPGAGVLDAAEHLLDGLLGRVGRLDHVVDGRGRRDLALHGAAGGKADVLLHLHVGRVGCRDRDGAVVGPHRKDEVLSDQAFGDEPACGGLRLGQFGDRAAEVRGHARGEGVGVHETPVDHLLPRVGQRGTHRCLER